MIDRNAWAGIRTSPAQFRGRTDYLAATAILLGLTALAALWLGPLPAISRTAFSPAMIIHLGVIAFAAPLIGIGLAHAAARFSHWAPSMAWPLGASLLEFITVWGWHLPGAHEGAARSTTLFITQQFTFCASALAVWFFAFAGRNRHSAAGGVLACFLSFMHMTLLGMVLLLAPDVLYNPAICNGSFGLSPIGDQRLGGMLMAGWGGLAFLAGGIARAWCLVSGERGGRLSGGKNRDG
ncbi:MAG: cytochrome c oxidase assembly protein [Alphaproteobacteria bacterium]